MSISNKRRFIFWFALGALFIIFALSFLIKPVVVFLIKERIKKEWGAQSVIIKGSHLKIFYNIEFDDVQIHKQKDFDISFKELSISFNPWLVIVGSAPQLFLNDVTLINLMIDAKPLDFKLEHGEMHVNRHKKGALSISKIQSGNWILSDIKSVVIMSNKDFIFEPLAGHIYSGLFEGNIKLKLDDVLGYEGQIKLNNLSLADFINAFKLDDKTKVQGLMNGHLTINGRGGKLRTLNGDFSSDQQGGFVVIKDTRFLDHFAGQSNQSSVLLMESLKNYHYNTGNLRLSLDQGVALLEINLNGETGKRNFEIRLHDFL